MTRELRETKPPGTTSKNAAWALLIFGVVYFVLLLTLHIIKPEIDPTWRFISEYAIGQYGWMMTLTFICIAGSQLSLFVAVRTQIKTIVGYAGLFLLMVSAIGILIAAAFQTDPINTNPEAMTESGSMHILGASLDWTPFATLFISLSLARTRFWFAKRRQLLTASSVAIFLTMVFIICTVTAPYGKFGPGVYAGFVGRLLILSYLVYFWIVSVHIIKSGRDASLPASEISTAHFNH